MCDVVLVPAWRYPVEQKETLQAFCTFQPGTIFFSLRFKDVWSELFFSSYRYSVDGSSSRALSIACGSSSWFVSVRLEPNQSPAFGIGFSSVTFHNFLHGRSVSQRPLCVSGVRWMFFPPVAMRMVGLPLPPCGGPLVTFTTSHCHF